jgi:kumamolisin
VPEDQTAAALAGSTREHRGAHRVGTVDPDTTVEVTVYLRPRRGAPTRIAEDAAEPAPMLSRSELAEARGADPGEMAAVEQFASNHGLDIIERDAPGRRLRLRAGAAAMGRAFGVDLQRFQHLEGTYRGHTGPVLLPPELSDAVVAVLGLDDRRQAETRLRHAKDNSGVSYTPVTVGTAYGVQPGARATGVCVALIELGGGFSAGDLATYFTSLGLAEPEVEAVAVDGASNAPSGGSSGPDAEVMLDIEVVGAVANGTRIAVYFAPNTDQGFADAISAAVHDASRKPAVISISWGGPENTYTAQAVKAFEDTFTDAALAGTTVFVAAGDSGSSDGATDGLAHVDYPASSPQVVGCGGTQFHLEDGVIVTEVVWDDLPSGGATGGGVSASFPVPSWQESAGVPVSANPGQASGRGVPDVAGDADPASGYQIRVDGDDIVVGGTSAVAPLYAALAALAVAKAGEPLGFINRTLYQLGDSGFRDITEGDNGAYSAASGWDACTGLGSPKATPLIEALAARRASPAGTS